MVARAGSRASRWPRVARDPSSAAAAEGQQPLAAHGCRRVRPFSSHFVVRPSRATSPAHLGSVSETLWVGALEFDGTPNNIWPTCGSGPTAYQEHDASCNRTERCTSPADSRRRAIGWCGDEPRPDAHAGRLTARRGAGSGTVPPSPWLGARPPGRLVCSALLSEQWTDLAGRTFERHRRARGCLGGGGGHVRVVPAAEVRPSPRGKRRWCTMEKRSV